MLCRNFRKRKSLYTVKSRIYSTVPNKRAGANSRADRKILETLLNVGGPHNRRDQIAKSISKDEV